MRGGALPIFHFAALVLGGWLHSGNAGPGPLLDVRLSCRHLRGLPRTFPDPLVTGASPSAAAVAPPPVDGHCPCLSGHVRVGIAVFVFQPARAVGLLCGQSCVGPGERHSSCGGRGRHFGGTWALLRAVVCFEPCRQLVFALGGRQFIGRGGSGLVLEAATTRTPTGTTLAWLAIRSVPCAVCSHAVRGTDL